MQYKSNIITTILRISAFCIALFFLLASNVHAAKLYLETEINEVGVGQKLEVIMKLNTEGETINALKGVIYIPEIFNVEEIRDGNSTIAFWNERPELRNNTIQFSGIIPGGYNDTESLIFSFILKSNKEGEGSITQKDVQVLLHDGSGTPISTQANPLLLTVERNIPLQEFVEMTDDQEPPEQFTPIITQDPNLLGGDYFVVFTTQDKGSGIDHYEIFESKKSVNDSEIHWQTATNPYRLENQSLHTFIYIKAVDKIGNERIAVISPEVRAGIIGKKSLTFIIIISALILLVLYIRKRVKKRNNVL